MDLAGKDYFTQEEAAHYCGVSKRQFQRIAPSHGIRPAAFGGKLLYRRTDLQRAIEHEWRRSEGLTAPTSSTGTTRKESATATR